MGRRKLSMAGFTMIELLIWTVLSSTFLAAVYSVFRVQVHTLKAQANRQDALDYGRNVLDMMVREIRNIGANPLGTSAGTNCAGSPTAGTPGIVTATSTTLKFTYDYRGSTAGSNPDGKCNNPDEEVTYQYQTPGPQNCASGTGDIVRIANGATDALTMCNVTAFSYDYYAHDASTPMSPVVLANVHRVKVTFTLQSKNPDPNFGGALNLTLYSNINLANVGS